LPRDGTGSSASWEPSRYLRFGEERGQPCRDLVARIQRDAVQRVVDLGCGPGNSTAVLRARWPEAECFGVDSSTEMLEVARKSDPVVRWVHADIRTWEPTEPVDLLFSNAALHWLPDHEPLFPRLLRLLTSGGVFAVQMPANTSEPYQDVAEELRCRAPWTNLIAGPSSRSDVGESEFYYRILSPLVSRLELWDTRYLHVLDGPEAIVDWTRGAGLKDWLAALPRPADRDRFLCEYLSGVARRYPREPDGKVLFPFLRRFIIAYRK
jgi:trans-aconitate 2-methyltransferase